MAYRRQRQYAGGGDGGVRGGKLQAKRGDRDGAVVAQGDVQRMHVGEAVGGGADNNASGDGEGRQKQSFELRMHALPAWMTWDR